MVTTGQQRALISFYLCRQLFLSVLVVVFLVGSVTSSLAEETSESSPPPEEKEPVSELDRPELTVPGVGGVNVTHRFLSTSIEALSQRIDTFFGEERIYEEATGTYVQARGSVIYGRGGDFDFDGKFRAKLDLPQLEKKAKLVIESDNEKDDVEEFNRITSGNKLEDELDENDVSAALQFIVKEKERWNFSIRPGLRLSDPIKTFIKFRLRRSQPFGKWLSRGTIEAGYYSDRGWENKYKIEMERYIGDDNVFRSSSTVLWREDSPGNQFLGQSFQLTHFIDRRQLISFEIGTSAETRPNLHDESYFGSIRFRRDIHRGWLFLEVKPQVIWDRENNYEADPALVLSLEMLIGARHL